jgi:hypothetical protein
MFADDFSQAVLLAEFISILFELDLMVVPRSLFSAGPSVKGLLTGSIPLPLGLGLETSEK